MLLSLIISGNQNTLPYFSYNMCWRAYQFYQLCNHIHIVHSTRPEDNYPWCLIPAQQNDIGLMDLATIKCELEVLKILKWVVLLHSHSSIVRKTQEILIYLS